MGSLMFLKKFCFFFLLISTSLLSTAFAGRQLKSVNKFKKEAVASTYKELQQGEETDIIHGRLLRVNTKDYGTYDPAPTFVKPPFKLIPN